MTRMTRDFSLVLLGASILTAGYFLATSPDMEKKADEQAADRVGGGQRDSNGHYHYRPGFVMLYVHSGGYSGGAGRSPAVGGVSRGGFGGAGRAAGTGG